MMLKIAMGLTGLLARAINSLCGRAPRQAMPAPGDLRLLFFKALPPHSQEVIADDIKLLIGWVSEAASKSNPPPVNQLLDRASTFRKVSGFTSPTDMRPLKASYRIIRPPLQGEGYYSLLLAQLGEHGEIAALVLVNRLFRLPVILQEPLGVISDVITTGALLLGVRTGAVKAAAKAGLTAYRQAGALGVPLITCGQSMAGGLAQYQVAAIIDAFPWERPQAGFITFNAAQAGPSIERFGPKPGEIPGINFSKDCDPGVGPRSLLPNHTGLQIYIRPDGTAGLSPGPYSLISALLRPWEHFLGSFTHVALGEVLCELGLRDHKEASGDMPH